MLKELIVFEDLYKRCKNISLLTQVCKYISVLKEAVDGNIDFFNEDLRTTLAVLDKSTNGSMDFYSGFEKAKILKEKLVDLELGKTICLSRAEIIEVNLEFKRHVKAIENASKIYDVMIYLVQSWMRENKRY